MSQSPMPRKAEMPRGKPLARAGGLSRAVPIKATRKDSVPLAVRRLVLARDGYRCVYCGKSVISQRYSLGHRVRASQGGKPVPENLITVHGWGGEACHGDIDLYKDPADGIGGKGYRLPSTADPAMEPVLIASAHGPGALVWLTSGGRYSAEPPRGLAAGDLCREGGPGHD